jgi:hypothetical protein
MDETITEIPAGGTIAVPYALWGAGRYPAGFFRTFSAAEKKIHFSK